MYRPKVCMETKYVLNRKLNLACIIWEEEEEVLWSFSMQEFKNIYEMDIVYKRLLYKEEKIVGMLCLLNS